VTALIVDTRHGERNWRTPPCCITGRFSEHFAGCSNPGRTILIGEREGKDRANARRPFHRNTMRIWAAALWLPFETNLKERSDRPECRKIAGGPPASSLVRTCVPRRTSRPRGTAARRRREQMIVH
jgi:hypothetical protein